MKVSARGIRWVSDSGGTEPLSAARSTWSIVADGLPAMAATRFPRAPPRCSRPIACSRTSVEPVPRTIQYPASPSRPVHEQRVHRCVDEQTLARFGEPVAGLAFHHAPPFTARGSARSTRSASRFSVGASSHAILLVGSVSLTAGQPTAWRAAGVEGYQVKDFEVRGYEPHAAIEADITVRPCPPSGRDTRQEQLRGKCVRAAATARAC